MASDYLALLRHDSLEDETVVLAFAVVRLLNEWLDEHCEGVAEMPQAGVTVTAYSVDVFIGDHAAWSSQCDSIDQLTVDYLMAQLKVASLDLGKLFENARPVSAIVEDVK